MYIPIGNDMAVRDRSIVGIFDLDNCSYEKRTREFLAKSEKNKRVVSGSWELPRSFTVCAGKHGEEERVYLSPLSPGTLEKRANNLL